MISDSPNSAETISFIFTIFLIPFGEMERTKWSLCQQSPPFQSILILLSWSSWNQISDSVILPLKILRKLLRNIGNCLETKCQTSWMHTHCLHPIYLCSIISQYLFQNITMLLTWDLLNRGKKLMFDVSDLRSIQWTWQFNDCPRKTWIHPILIIVCLHL